MNPGVKASEATWAGPPPMLTLRSFTTLFRNENGTAIPAPNANIQADYSGMLVGPGANRKLEVRRFATLVEYSRATHQDQHSVTVDYDIFVNVPKLDAQDLKKVQALYKAEDFDFRLKPGCEAVDHGIVLPNITDGFTGQAPDLGALELGQTPPHYGPRL